MKYFAEKLVSELFKKIVKAKTMKKYELIKLVSKAGAMLLPKYYFESPPRQTFKNSVIG